MDRITHIKELKKIHKMKIDLHKEEKEKLQQFIDNENIYIEALSLLINKYNTMSSIYDYDDYDNYCSLSE